MGSTHAVSFHLCVYGNICQIKDIWVIFTFLAMHISTPHLPLVDFIYIRSPHPLRGILHNWFRCFLQSLSKTTSLCWMIWTWFITSCLLGALSCRSGLSLEVAWGTKKCFIFYWAVLSYLHNQNPPSCWILKTRRIMSKRTFSSRPRPQASPQHLLQTEGANMQHLHPWPIPKGTCRAAFGFKGVNTYMLEMW